MKYVGALALTTTDHPKIKPTATGADVTFDLYNVSLDELRQLMGKQLQITIEVVD